MRKKELKDYCDAVIADFAKKAANKAEAEQEAGYISRTVARIIDNLQITVKNIHIRYED